MEHSPLDTCLGLGVPCRSPTWPTPPAAHSHPHLSNSNMLTNNTSPGISTSNNSNHFLGYPSLASSSSSPTTSPHQDSNTMDEMNSSNNNNSNFINNNNSGSLDNGQMSSHNLDRKSNSPPSGTQSSLRQNTVGNIELHGEVIVSLVIDNKERLCLAQISNTLLKDYSYNEIHNRRVALGITCVQCTPVQLEILRRAGAMPVSSRRCGMITKREAERLVKSFLEENTPPKLPDDFAFDVHHECGWGCRGLFEPSRYNSSRAKCIKCSYCNIYFSPNKFIFHFHRTPESKYNHPDAANFNSWRRHLKLYSGNDNEEIVHKWEDVKAMFNGGTRKRLFSTSSSPSTTSSPSSSLSNLGSSSMNLTSSHVSRQASGLRPDGSSSSKKLKPNPVLDNPSSYLQKPPAFPNPFNPYSWLAGGAPGKNPHYPFMAMNSNQSMCFGFPGQNPSAKDAMTERMKASTLAPPSWMMRSASAAGPFPLTSMDLFWGDKAFPFQQAAALGFRGTGYPPTQLPGAGTHSALPTSMIDTTDHLSPRSEDASCIPSPRGSPQNLMKSNLERGEKTQDRMSAFKRVVPSAASPSSSISPQLCPGEDWEGGPYCENGRKDDEENDNEDISAEDLTTHAHKDTEDIEEIDVEEDIDDRSKRKFLEDEDTDIGASQSGRTDSVDIESERTVEPEEGQITPEEPQVDVCLKKSSQVENSDNPPLSSPVPSPMQSSSHTTHPPRTESCSPTGKSPASNDDASEAKTEGDVQFGKMSKEELCQTLKSELESRRRREKEVNVLKDTFREEVSREKNFREHMAQQLEMLRETLTGELEQERKIRYSLQQRLKEAHDALQTFSCSLLNARREGYPLKDAAILPR